MSFPKVAAFNPVVSSVPNLDSSSGNPQAYKDPNSVASIGKKMQAMTDQTAADTLYDPPAPAREGFRVDIETSGVYSSSQITLLVSLTLASAALLLCAFVQRK
jgi:hypothetical protein